MDISRIGPSHPEHPRHNTLLRNLVRDAAAYDRLRTNLAALAAQLDDDGHHDIADRIRDHLHD